MRRTIALLAVLSSTVFLLGQGTRGIQKILGANYTVATLPSSAAPGTLAVITDGNPGCLAGGGGTYATCLYNGSSWITASGGANTFDQVGAGTNGNTLLVGAGGSLAPTGGGTITANVGAFLNGTLNAFPIFTGTTGQNNLGTSLLTTDLTTLTSAYTGGLNVAGSGSGCITFSGLTSGSAKFCVPAVAGTPNQINWPTATAGANQFLKSDGGNPQQLSWAASSATPCTTTALSIQYNNGGAFGCVTDFTFSGHTITSAAAGLLDLSAQTGIGSFKVPVVAGFVPTANGSLGYDSTANLFVGGVNGSTGKLPYFTGANPGNNNCAKWTTGGVLADFGAACNPVTSVFSRTGAVVAAANDYTLDQLAAAAAAWTTANADQPLTFNFASTTSGRVSFKIAEGTASTSAGTPYLAQLVTLIGSTAAPLDIQNSENGALALPLLKLETTLNTSGSPDMFTILDTDTSSGASTNFIHLKGGSSAATDEFIVSKSGTISANGSYGATATSSIVTLRGAGAHIESTATAAPTVTANCGTSPAIQTGGTDNAFRLNVGTGGSATACTVTFQKAFTNIPACNVNVESGTVFNHTIAPTTTTVVITAASAWAASTVLDVNCHI